MTIEIHRHCKFGTLTSILFVQYLHKLLNANSVLVQIWKMGAVLSPLLSTNRHQFKTPPPNSRISNIRMITFNMIPNLSFSEDRGNKLEHFKWFCPCVKYGSFITEQPSLLQRAITHMYGK